VQHAALLAVAQQLAAVRRAIRQSCASRKVLSRRAASTHRRKAQPVGVQVRAAQPVAHAVPAGRRVLRVLALEAAGHLRKRRSDTAARQRVAREPASARHAPGTQTWRAATDAGAWPLEPQQPSQAPERAQRRRWEPRREEAAHASRERWALRASVAVAHAPRGTAAMPRASCSSHSRSSNVQCAASPMVCGGRKQRS
jgi:hypothetical protein